MSHKPTEERIEDWDHFCKYCNQLQGYGENGSDTTVLGGNIVIFRGHQDSDWRLTPSIYREMRKRRIDFSQAEDIEKELIDKVAEKWFPSEMKFYINSRFWILYIMQQYGMKTRILDWTSSWKIAAYFATETHSEWDKKDAAVWCVNKTQIENRFNSICEKEYDKHSRYRGIGFLKDEAYRRCFQVTGNCPVKQDCAGQAPYCNAIFFKDVFSASSDLRITIQASVFTFCLGICGDHIEPITQVLGTDTRKYCKKLIIPKELKERFRENLQPLKGKILPIINPKWFEGTFDEIMKVYAEKANTKK